MRKCHIPGTKTFKYKQSSSPAVAILERTVCMHGDLKPTASKVPFHCLGGCGAYDIKQNHFAVKSVRQSNVIGLHGF